MPSLDCSGFWNNKAWTGGRVAILPMRLQPPHAGHINLILNAAKRFARTVVLLYDNQPSSRDPFTVEDRARWLGTILRGNGIEGKVFVHSMRGIDYTDAVGWKALVLKLSKGLPFIFGSYNPDVARYCEALGFSHMRPGKLEAIIPVHPDVENTKDGISGLIRGMLEGGEDIPQNYLPLGLDEVELRAAHKKYTESGY